MSVAFGIRAQYTDNWEPGVIAVGDSEFNLKEALSDGGGEIVVPSTDALLVATLDEQPALKRVPVKSSEDQARAAAAKVERERLDALPLDDLKKQAEGLVNKSASKKDHVDALVERYTTQWTPDGTEVTR